MMDFETVLHTSLDRNDLFTWQAQILELRGPRNVVRVDTWEIPDHPSPDGGAFTLYACAIVLMILHPQTHEGRLHL